MVLRSRRRRGPVDVTGSHGDFDLSLLRKPIGLGVEGALQVARCLQSGTPEVRALLLHECELLYECKVCRSMFRSLTNLVAHKRVYCTETYCESKIRFVEQRCENETVVVRPEAPRHRPRRREDFKENVDGKEEGSEEEEEEEEEEEKMEVKEEEEKEVAEKQDTPPKRNLRSASNESCDAAEADSEEKVKEEDEGPSVLQQMLQGQFEGESEEFQFYTKAVERTNLKDEERQTNTVTLKPVEGNSNAVYQTATPGPPPQTDSGETQNDRKRRRKQVHQVRQFDDGEEEEENPAKKLRMDVGEVMVLVEPSQCDDYLPSNLRHSSQLIKQLKRRKDCDLRSLTCLKCSLRFSIMKNLYRHMSTVHSEEKRIFPCLYCKCEYGLFWNLCRHITVKHKKNKNQIDRIKDLLKSKSYIKKSDQRSPGNVKSNFRDQNSVKKRTAGVNHHSGNTETKQTSEKVDVKAKQISEKVDVKAKQMSEKVDVKAKQMSEKVDVKAKQMSEKVDEKAGKTAADKTEDRVSKDAVSGKAKGSETSQSGIGVPKMTSSKVSETVLRIRTTTPSVKSEEQGTHAIVLRARSAAPSEKSDSDSEAAGDGASVKSSSSQEKSVKSSSSHGKPEITQNQATPPSAVKNGKPLPLRVQQALKIDWDSMRCPKCQKTFWKKKSLKKHSCSGKPKPNTPSQKKKEPPKPAENPAHHEESKKIETASLRTRRSVSIERQQEEAVSQSAASPQRSSSAEREVLTLHTSPPLDSSPIRRDIAQQKLQDAQQLQGMVDEVNLKCLKCNQKYTSLSNLHQHCIRHMGWKRYKCRLCVYTSYNYSEIAVHLRRVHMPQVRGSIIHRYIHDLETDKLNIMSYKLHPRPPADTSHLSPAEKIANRIKPEVDVSNIRKVPTEAFNISTRNSPRKFDTSPYRAVDQMSVLSTRRGLYVKPQMKTRRGSSSEDSNEDGDGEGQQVDEDAPHEVEDKEEDSKSETSSVASMPTSSGSLDSRLYHMPTLCSSKPSTPVVKTVGGRSLAEKTKLLLQSSQGTDSVLMSLPKNWSNPQIDEIVDCKDTDSVGTTSDIIETTTEVVAVSERAQDIDVVVVVVSDPSDSMASDDLASQGSQSEEPVQVPCTIESVTSPPYSPDMTLAGTAYISSSSHDHVRAETQPETDIEEACVLEEPSDDLEGPHDLDVPHDDLVGCHEKDSDEEEQCSDDGSSNLRREMEEQLLEEPATETSCDPYDCDVSLISDCGADPEQESEDNDVEFEQEEVEQDENVENVEAEMESVSIETVQDGVPDTSDL